MERHCRLQESAGGDLSGSPFFFSHEFCRFFPPELSGTGYIAVMLKSMRRLAHLTHATRKRQQSDGMLETLMLAADRIRWMRYRRLERKFDGRYGIDTSGVIDGAVALDVSSEHGMNATGYQAIQIPVFRQILRDLPVDPAGYAFMDFGSGKGRALMMAAEYGFKRVIGVEFSPMLHETARRNIENFRMRNPAASEIVLECRDAAAAEIPRENLVCFLYNPFDCAVMRKLLANLEGAHWANKLPMVIVYRNPVCAHLLDSAAFLSKVRVAHTHHIYQTTETRERRREALVERR
jgi:SAM-dependent methyltransferase